MKEIFGPLSEMMQTQSPRTAVEKKYQSDVNTDVKTPSLEL